MADQAVDQAAGRRVAVEQRVESVVGRQAARVAVEGAERQPMPELPTQAQGPAWSN